MLMFLIVVKHSWIINNLSSYADAPSNSFILGDVSSFKLYSYCTLQKYSMLCRHGCWFVSDLLCFIIRPFFFHFFKLLGECITNLQYRWNIWDQNNKYTRLVFQGEKTNMLNLWIKYTWRICIAWGSWKPQFLVLVLYDFTLAWV
jgi:hypothetical protein